MKKKTFENQSQSQKKSEKMNEKRMEFYSLTFLIFINIDKRRKDNLFFFFAIIISTVYRIEGKREKLELNSVATRYHNFCKFLLVFVPANVEKCHVAS